MSASRAKRRIDLGPDLQPHTRRSPYPSTFVLLDHRRFVALPTRTSRGWETAEVAVGRSPSGAVSIADDFRHSLLVPALAIYALAAVTLATAWSFHRSTDHEERGVEAPPYPISNASVSYFQ
jgi:hypothetical protein